MVPLRFLYSLCALPCAVSGVMVGTRRASQASLPDFSAFTNGPWLKDQLVVAEVDRQNDLSHLPFATDLIGMASQKSRQSQGLLEKAFPFLPFSKSKQDASEKPSMPTGISKRKPFLWVHIHKAGGTFMCELAQLAGEAVVEPSDGACNWRGQDQYKDSGKERLSCDDRARYFNHPKRNATWGQIEREFSQSDRCWKKFNYGVMLREPISLLESEVNYHPGCWLFGGPCGEGPEKPDEFLSEFRNMLGNPFQHGGPDQFPLWKFFDNFQTRVLAPAMDVPAGKLNATHLHAAQKALKQFTVVARLEDMPRHGSAIFERMGWRKSMMQHIGEPVNPSPHDFHFNKQEKAWLRKVNQFDDQLYKTFAPK